MKFPVVAPAFRQSTEIIPQAELEALLTEADRINNEIAFGVELPDELAVAGLNIQIKGIQFQEVEGREQDLELRIPPIPALMVIPGNIGFLNQFFSVLIFTENGSPRGSGLSVHDVRARLILPPGPDRVAGTWAEPGDDPLRMARLGPDKIVQEIQSVRHPGPDGVLGTDDDVGRLQPGEAGQAEFLVEGLQEGLHVMDLELTASLDGLAAGTVNIKGRAAGSVLVRNPRFSMAFTHPRTIRFGEPYDATVTVLNTSPTVANLVNVTLRQASISGGVLESPETVDLGTIPPGETRTATFRVRAQRTGAITFSNLTTSDDSLVGRFRLKMGIDERGVALSPDTLLMPDFVDDLPPELIAAATRVLGQALSVATAGQTPPGIRRVSSATVTARVVELAEAGQRARYGDELERVLLDLLLDWQGGRKFDAGFDQILRETDAGREWREALMAELEVQTSGGGASAGTLLRKAAPDLAGRNERWFLASGGPDAASFSATAGNSRADSARSEISRSVVYTGGPSLRRIAVTAPEAELYFNWRLTESLPLLELDVIVVNGDGTATGFAWNIADPPAGARYRYRPASGNGLLEIDLNGDGLFETTLAAVQTDFVEALPGAIAVIQDLSVHAGRARIPCEIDKVLNYGTVLAVLFSKPMSQASVNVPAAYMLDNGNVAASVRIQPGGRVALLNMRLPVGALMPRTMTIGGIADPRGNPLAEAMQPVLATAVDGISIHGRVVRSDGSFAANVPVTLTMYDEAATGFECVPFTVRVSQVRTDGEGRFTFDYVMAGIPYSVSATDTSGLSDEMIALIQKSAAGDEFRRDKLQELADQPGVRNSLLEAFATASLPQAIAMAEGLDRALLRDLVSPNSARVGTEVPVALRFRGRGTVTGRALLSDGVTPAPGAAVNLFPDPDSRELGRGLFADGDGRFAFFGVPLGLFDVRVSTSSGLFRTVSDVLEIPGETKEVEVVLSSTAVVRTTLRGRVTEADTVTVHPGARVFVGKFDPVGRFTNVVAAVTADAGGYWEAGNIPVGAWDLVAVSFDNRLKGERRNVAAVAGSATFSSIALQGVSTVIGRVETSTGQPVPNAIVAGGTALVRTDGNGFFTLDGVPTGKRQIAAGLERNIDAGILFARTGNAEVNVLPGVDNFVVIRFSASGSIAGRVIDAAGNPVPNVRVALPSGLGFFWVNADANGNYFFPNLGLDSYLVSAPSPPAEDRDVSGLISQIATGSQDEILAAIGEAFAIFTGVNNPYLNGGGDTFNPLTWGYAKTKLSFDGQVAVADIRYLREGTVPGTVLNGQGVPIGARVRLTGIGPLLNGDLGFVIRGERNSDPAVGTFSFPGQLLAGDWGLQAASPFFPVVISTSGRTTSVDPDATGIVLQFPATQEINGRLKGIVLMPDGTPAGPDIAVKVSFGDLEVRTVEDGTFDTQIALPALTNGQAGRNYTVEAEDLATGMRGQSTIRILPGVDNEVEVRLLDFGALEVTVLHADGAPAAGATVAIAGGAFPRERFQGVAAGDGRILFTNLFAGPYAASAQLVSGPTTITGRRGATVSAGQTASVTVTLTATGTIRGVFLSQELQPVTFAQIAVGNLGFATTDEQGRFEVAGVPLGTYQVVGQDSVTGRFGVVSATLSSQGQILELQLDEQARGEIAGNVVNSYNDGFVPGATVTLTQPGGLVGPRSVTTDPQGGFRFPGTPAGSFTLRAVDPVTKLSGTVSATLPSTATLFQINVPLQPLATLAGTVFRPDGLTPAANVAVTLTRGNFVRTADTDENGRVAFVDLALGDYTVRAQAIEVSENRNAERIAVKLSATGPAPDFAMTLRGVGRVQGQVRAGDGVTPVIGAQVEIQLDSNLFQGTKITALSDAEGNFGFNNIPVGAYRVTARSQGLGGGFDSSVAAHGSIHQISIILTASGTVAGRMVRADGITPVAGIDVVLSFPGQLGQPGRAVGRTNEDGAFSIGPIPVGNFSLQALGPTFAGIARLPGSVSANGEEVDLGDVIFDEDDPFVVSVTPEHTADGVDINTTVELLFNEALDPSRIEPAGIYIRSGNGGGTVPASVTLLEDAEGVMRLVRLTPNAPLQSEVTYEVVVIDDVRLSATGGVLGRGPVDLVGRPMVVPFVSRFTTRDQDSPQLLSFTPVAGAEQIDPRAVIRLTFNEPIRSDGIDFSLTGPFGPVAGAATVGVNGLVLVFTPQVDLSPNSTYTASVSGIRDLAGNFALDQPFVSTFATIDTIGPAIAELRIKGGFVPTAGATVLIVALLAEPEDGASVRMTADFVTLGQTQPDVLELPLTLPQSGSVTVGAFGIDRFGNEGEIAELTLTVVENQPPVVAFQLLAPAAPPVGTGQFVQVRVSAIDDGEITQLRAALSGAVTFPLVTTSGGPITLGGTVPAQTGPGRSVLVLARATDNAGLTSGEVSFEVPVFDATPPTLAITGPAAGAQFLAGDIVPVTVNAGDNFGVSRIDTTVTGAFAFSGSFDFTPQPGTHERIIEIPIPGSVPNDGSSFTVTVIAFDEAGLSSVAQNRVFAMRDLIPPAVVSVAPEDGATNVVLRPSIDVQFSKELDAATVSTATVMLTDDGGEPVEVTVSLVGGNQTIRLRPVADLDPLIEHTIVIGTDVADTVGNQLVEEFRSAFTTFLPGGVPPAAGRVLSSASLRFDGVNDYVQIPHSGVLNLVAAVTVEGWVRTTQTGLSGVASLVEKWNSNDGYPYAMRLIKDTGTLHFSARDSSGRTSSVVSISAVNDGEWHHFAGVRDGSEIKIYIDGVLESVAEAIFDTPFLNNSSAVFMGRRGNNTSQFLQGDLAEIRIWNHLREEVAIQEDMHRTLTGLEAGLAGYYRGNEGSGDTTYDRTIRIGDGRLGNGTVAHMPAWIGDGPPLVTDVEIAVAAGRETTVVLAGFDPAGDDEDLLAIVTALPLHGRLFQTNDGVTQAAEITAVPALVADLERRAIYVSENDFIGLDSIGYTLSNGAVESATASVRLYVTPAVFAVPTAVDDTVSTFGGRATAIDGLLDNDSHPDGQSLQIVAYSQPANGQVVLEADGTFTYTSVGDFAGDDTFTYTVAGESDFWQRQRDFAPGPVVFSHEGNPLPDRFGFPVWSLEYVRGDDLAGAEPWYSNAGARLIWDNAWFGGPGAWNRANDTSPPIFPTAPIHANNDSDSWNHIPVVRWLSPIAGDLDILGKLRVGWSGAGGADSLLDVDVIVAHYDATTGAHQPLLARTVSKPPLESATGEVVEIPVELLNIAVEMGDSIVVSLRAHNVVSGRWIGLTDTFLTIVPSGATATATVTVTVDPNRAPVAGILGPVAGRALRFDGIDDGASFAGTADRNEVSESFTMDLWVNPGAPRNATSEATSGISGAGGQRYAVFPEHKTAPMAGAGISVGTNGVAVFEHSGSYLPSLLVHSVPISGWTHLAVVYENNRPRLYMNGEFVRQGLQSQRTVLPSFFLSSEPSYGAYAGALDEYRVWDRALSDQEIAANYEAGANPADSSLVAWFRFDEADGLDLFNEVNPELRMRLRGSPNTPERIEPGAPVVDYLQRERVVFERPALLVLHGFDPDGDLLTASIQSLPLNGRLFQFTGSSAGAEITSAPALVADELRRVVYVPDEGFLGSDSFAFLVNDGVEDSNVASVFVEVIPPFFTTSTDLWDVAQGTGVTATSGMHPSSSPQNMFGGSGGVEPPHTIFQDGQPAGFTHFVEWETDGPIWLEGFRLFAMDEPVVGNRGITEMRLFGRGGPDEDFALLATRTIAANPYFPDRFLRFTGSLPAPFVGQQFRAEFDQFGEGAFFGPRIQELDAIGETVVFVPSPEDPDELAPNRAPRGVDDTLVATEGFPATTGNVLANDFDPEGDPLSVGSFTQPANGSVVSNGDGTFTYTPTPGFSGEDAFTYRPFDGFQLGTSATVFVTVIPSDVVVWTNPSGGSFHVAENWFPPRVPTGNDRAVIDLAGTYTVTVTAAAAFASLRAGGEEASVILRHTSGALTLAQDSLFSSGSTYELAGGTLRGLGTLTIEGVFTWTGGTMRDAGRTVIAAGATATISGAANKGLDAGRVLENAGSLVVSGGTIFFNLNGFGGGAVVNNLAGASMELRGAPNFRQNTASPGSAVNNAGHFLKTGGGETIFSANVPFINTGTVELVSGSLRPEAGFTQAGVLTGSGGITGSFTNSGIIRPGSPTGIISVAGNFAQTAAGRIEIDIAGLEPGSGYDRLQVGGAAALNGALAITMLDGFIPEEGAQFPILSFGSRSGDFAAVEGIDQGDFSFDRTFTGNEMLLTAVAGAEAGGLAVSGVSAVSYDQWRLQTFSDDQRATPGTCGPLDDADGDGVCNLLEFAFGGNPLDPKRRLLPRLTLVDYEGDQYLGIAYRRRTAAGSMRYVVETSNDLATWHSNALENRATQTMSVRQLPGEPGIEEVVERDLTPLRAHTERFVRVRVEK